MLQRTVVTDRLAELVADLSGCPAPLAQDAVRRAAEQGHPGGDEERLELVARALVAVRRRQVVAGVVAGGGSSSPTSSTTPPPSASSIAAC